MTAVESAVIVTSATRTPGVEHRGDAPPTQRFSLDNSYRKLQECDQIERVVMKD